jgi:ubiquinone/menaquinone biosynthesis C-methylase UbiE
MRHLRPADDIERRKWQNPEATLSDIGLKPGMTFIDSGCGGGFFTIPAARMVGESGAVYGIDISAAAIENLKASASKEGLYNLKLTAGRAEEIVLCQKCADIVFFGIVLHDFEDPLKVLKNARGMLKPDGRLVNLDWKDEPMEMGPPLEIRFSEDKAVKLITGAGFRVEIVKEAGPYHYLIVATI